MHTIRIDDTRGSVVVTSNSDFSGDVTIRSVDEGDVWIIPGWILIAIAKEPITTRLLSELETFLSEWTPDDLG